MTKLTFAVLALGIGAASLNAQSSPLMRVSVPFDFNAGEKSLPAGEYNIRTDKDIVWIRSADAQSSIMVLAHGAQVAQTPAQPNVTFHQYEGRYFLSQVWFADGNQGKELSPSKTERRQRSILQEHASERISPAVVTVTAKR